MLGCTYPLYQRAFLKSWALPLCPLEHTGQLPNYCHLYSLKVITNCRFGRFHTSSPSHCSIYCALGHRTQCLYTVLLSHAPFSFTRHHFAVLSREMNSPTYGDEYSASSQDSHVERIERSMDNQIERSPCTCFTPQRMTESNKK